MNRKILDLRGLSCPQPVLETKQAIENPAFESLEILLDTQTSLENIKRLLGNRKDIEYKVIEEGEDFKVTLLKAKD
ncbi:MAG: preprotein translocase subunit TatB [Syntrophus sp. (in: bacteria)]|nr:preprotein translocase subunit TatB [Syntrophus sp. (in: bacteria)]